MQTAMPRHTTPKARAAKPSAKGTAAPALKTHALFVRVTPATADELEAVTKDLNAAAEASGDPRQWSQSDVVRALLTRWLRDRKPGDLP